MARSRNIKPGFFTNEDLVELDFATRLLFAGLWTVADKEGRLQDRPKKIKIDVFPADNLDIDEMLQSLHECKFIVRYVVNGSKFIQITNWTKHQNPHHTEKASEIPGIDGELTVKAPLEPRESQKHDGGNPADSLIPDSLIPDSLQETQPTVVGAERAPQSRGSRLPADWVMPEAWGMWAISEFPQWPWDRVTTIACDFADYWHAKAGKDAVKTDWFATWRRWCRKAHENVRAPPMSFRERDAAIATARVHEMTGGLVSAKPPGHRADALQEVFDATPRLVG